MDRAIQKETEYGVKVKDLTKISPDLEANLQPDDKVTLTVDEGMVDEVLSFSIDKFIGNMGITLLGKSPEQQAEIKHIIGNAINELRSKNLFNVKLREDDTPEELRDLYGDEEKAERGDKYGVKTEKFNAMMEELVKSNAPSINIKENINPRIKKGDLISYLKNKK